LIHGHNWSFEITFVATSRDENGFVMDFGKLKALHEALCKWFDHTLVMNDTDPLRDDIPRFLSLHDIDNVVLVPDCSCEGIAMFVHSMANAHVQKVTDSRVHVKMVRVYEDSKNSACYSPVVV